MDLGEVTFVAFSACNLLRLGSYLPQIVCLARDQNGATCISFTSWSIWLFANGTTAAHAAVNLGDEFLAMLNGINAACCLAVLVLTAWKRAAFQRAGMPLHINRSASLASIALAACQRLNPRCSR